MYKQWVTFLPASLVDDILIVEKFSNKKWIVYSSETKLTTIINHTILCTPSMMSFCLKLYKSRCIHEIWCFLILFTFCLKGQGCLQTCSVTRYLCVGHPFAYTQHPIIRNGHTYKKLCWILGKIEETSTGQVKFKKRIKEHKKRSVLRFSKLRNE